MRWEVTFGYCRAIGWSMGARSETTVDHGQVWKCYTLNACRLFISLAVEVNE